MSIDFREDPSVEHTSIEHIQGDLQPLPSSRTHAECMCVWLEVSGKLVEGQECTHTLETPHELLEDVDVEGHGLLQPWELSYSCLSLSLRLKA